MAGGGDDLACKQTSGGGAPRFASSHDILHSMGELGDFASRELPDMPGTQVRPYPNPTVCLSPLSTSCVWCFMQVTLHPKLFLIALVRFHTFTSRASLSPQS